MAKLVFGLSQSLDGYVDHQEMEPGPALFRPFTDWVRDLTGSVYGLDPVAGRGAEARLGGGNSGVVALSETHIQPHLMVGDVEAGQALIPRY